MFQKNLQKELLTLKVRHWTRVVVLGIAAVLSSQITPLTLLRGYRMVGSPQKQSCEETEGLTLLGLLLLGIETSVYNSTTLSSLETAAW